jgi:hypothetical protein
MKTSKFLIIAALGYVGYTVLSFAMAEAGLISWQFCYGAHAGALITTLHLSAQKMIG